MSKVLRNKDVSKLLQATHNRVCTLKILALTSQAEELMTVLCKRCIDICALQETKRMPKSSDTEFECSQNIIISYTLVVHAVNIMAGMLSMRVFATLLKKSRNLITARNHGNLTTISAYSATLSTFEAIPPSRVTEVRERIKHMQPEKVPELNRQLHNWEEKSWDPTLLEWIKRHLRAKSCQY